MIFVKASFYLVPKLQLGNAYYQITTNLIKISKKINEANYTVVLVGEEANKQHSDHKEIGCKNWLNYEVAKMLILV
jgi:hypothetical protein